MEVDIGTVIDIGSKVVTMAAAIAAVTPTPKDDGVLKIVRLIVDFLGMNFGHAKNEKPDA